MLQKFVPPVIIRAASFCTASSCFFTFYRGVVPNCGTIFKHGSNK